MQLMEHEAPGGLSKGSLPQCMLGCILSYIHKWKHAILKIQTLKSCLWLEPYLFAKCMSSYFS